jgi:predicted secreted protein
MKTTATLLSLLLLATTVSAQNLIVASPDVTGVTLTATSTLQVDNDRMTIVVQAEAEKPSATAAAAEVNAKMTKALATAKAVSGVTAKTLNYSTNQVFEKQKFVRWRVTQWMEVETADFAAGANLATKLQDEGLNLVSLTFGVSPDARRKALATLQNEALVEWQALAKQAAASMGFGSYTPGRLTVNAGDSGPRPRFAAQAMMAKAPDSVAVSAGTSEMTVTVTGEAILGTERKRN